MRRAHRYWGAGLIRVQLKCDFPGHSLPSERTLQRYFRANGLQPLRSKSLPQPTERAREPHQTWQMDAKEQIAIQGGDEHCLLDVADEATGALLGGAIFPPEALGGGDPIGGSGGVARFL